MDEKQYMELCEACDHLLLSPDVKNERVAIQWLHVIRAHPLFLKNYENLFDTGSVSKNVPSFNLRRFFSSLLNLAKLILKKSSWWYASHEKRDNIDILFVSHFVSDSHSGKETDFYFGDLALNLLDNGISSSFALINHTTHPAENLAVKWKDSIVPRYILSSSAGFLRELKFHLLSFREYIRLNRYEKTLIPGLLKKVAARAAYEVRSGGAIPSRRIGKQVSQLIRKLNPRFVITTYEGHAWERIVYAEARNVNPDIYCFGYQHAAIFPLQHALKRNLANKFNPNAILSAGLVGFDQLEKSPNLKGIDLSVLGSDRGARMEEGIDNSTMRSTCLVIPEGVMSECVILFKFSLACAKACPEVEFIWRLHPLITFEEIEKEIQELNYVPDNIKLSNSPIADDIKASTCALYRGTTAIIQAINAGLIPIYYHTGEFIIDPISEVNDHSSYVKNTADFSMLLENSSRSMNQSSENFIRIREYCDKVFTTFNYQVLLEKIKAI